MTCGPTWVAIDPVRVISNHSTGELGHTIARQLKKAGAKVTVLEGPVTHRLQEKSIRTVKFSFYDELAGLVNKELGKNYNCMIHAAAVSDYRPKNTRSSKLSSELSELQLNLVPTAKIIEKIKRIAPKTFLVGFKLELSENQKTILKKARYLIQKANCDLVVANSLNGKSYRGYIIDEGQHVVAEAKTRNGIAGQLINILRDRL